MSEIRREVDTLTKAGKTDEAKALWHQGVVEMYAGKIIDDSLTKAAAALGRKGGQAKSERKTAAVRENGKKGGRPKKVKEI